MIKVNYDKNAIQIHFIRLFFQQVGRLFYSKAFFLLADAPGTTSTVFLYINAVINGLQGVLIFIIYCCGSDVREALIKLKSDIWSTSTTSKTNKVLGNDNTSGGGSGVGKIKKDIV